MKMFPAVLLASALICSKSVAEPATQSTTVTLTLKDHRFSPDKVTVPAGQKIRIELINQDPAMEEFDSEDLKVERDVTPKGRVTFSVGPLQPGTYAFIGELHADTASGELTAVAAD